MSKLPVSRVVNVQVLLTPPGAQAQSLSDLLILGSSDVIDVVERMRTYSGIAAVAADFGTTAPEYHAALAWFGQVPQPTQVRVGRWAKTDTKGGLRGAPISAANTLLSHWTAIADGAFKVKQDGGALTAVTALDFTGETNLNGVASVITAGLTTAALTITCVWNDVYGRFEFESDTLGAASAVSFLEAPAVGTDISDDLAGRATDSGAYVFDGIAAEALDAALAIFDNRFGQMWYASVAPEGNNDAQILAAAFIQASTNKHVWGVTTQEAATLLNNDTTSLAHLLSAAGYLRTLCQYSSSNAYAVCSALGRILTTNYALPASAITLKFKQEPGITFESLSVTQADAVESKNCNVFVAYDNDTAILEQGVMCDGNFADVVMGTDWLALAIQTRLYNILYTSPTKIPQTDQGVGILEAGIADVCNQGVINGLLAAGVWTADGFGQLKTGDFLQQGFYIYAIPLAQQDPTDRSARRAPPFKVAAKLAGAIHSVDVAIDVNQ